MRYAILFILLLTNLSLSAQTFTGKVKGKQGELLVGASVVASTESKSTVAYCLTSDKGEYKLTIPKGKNPASITASYIGYQKKTMPFADLKDGMTITLVEGDFQLKEVKIKGGAHKEFWRHAHIFGCGFSPGARPKHCRRDSQDAWT